MLGAIIIASLVFLLIGLPLAFVTKANDKTMTEWAAKNRKGPWPP